MFVTIAQPFLEGEEFRGVYLLKIHAVYVEPEVAPAGNPLADGQIYPGRTECRFLGNEDQVGEIGVRQFEVFLLGAELLEVILQVGTQQKWPANGQVVTQQRVNDVFVRVEIV